MFNNQVNDDRYLKLQKCADKGKYTHLEQSKHAKLVFPALATQQVTTVLVSVTIKRSERNASKWTFKAIYGFKEIYKNS